MHDLWTSDSKRKAPKISGSSDIWSDGKYAFISQASGGRYNERSEWSITLYTVT